MLQREVRRGRRHPRDPHGHSPPLQYPVRHCAFPFCKALCHMFFGLNILENARGSARAMSAMMIPTKGAPEGWKEGLMHTICTYDFK